ncbi:Methyltransferase-like protein 25 [Halocaridina rubra]|uniref:Methyltransferase-like protein 25 n=1 Tax=Halocaridina rubra TaxID=373956 RepID=A0AAN8X0C4_HALRR
MVDFITENHWENFLPEQLQRDLLSVPKDKLHHIPNASLTFDSKDSTSRSSEWNLQTTDLNLFLSAVRCHSLPSLGVLTPVSEILEAYGAEDVATFPIKGIMSEKKSHEVEIFSRVISRLAKGCDVDWIIDLGSGKGYLSTSLALQHGLNVIGIDSCPTNTSSASLRKSKLQKRWKNTKKPEQDRQTESQVNKSEQTASFISSNSKQDIVGTYIAVTAFVSNESNLLQIVKDSIDKEEKSLDNHFLEAHKCNQYCKSHLTEAVATESKTPTDSSLSCISKALDIPTTVSLENNDSESLFSTLGGKHNVYKETDSIYTNSTTPLVNHHFALRTDDNASFKVFVNTGTSNRKQSSFPVDDSEIALVGLHTCGNLASNSLHLYLSHPKVTFLCNVGCCYHLVEEEFLNNPFSKEVVNKDTMSPGTSLSKYSTKERSIDTPMHPSHIPNPNAGFPLCKILIEEKFSLGRNCRMLSCQPAERFCQRNLNSTMALYWRSLLQILLLERIGSKSDIPIVGRIASKCHDFPSYARAAFKKMPVNIEISDGELKDYNKKYLNHIEKIERFFLLRASLAPVIEGLMLLDRLAFLSEQGLGSAYLVQLFDPVTSPRCHAVIAIRKKL